MFPALLLAGTALSLPAMRWRLIGWAKSEAFYAGRPTSYWRRELLRTDWAAVYDKGRPPSSAAPERAPEAIRHLWGGDWPGFEIMVGSVDDTRAVWKELAKDEDAGLRRLADEYLKKRNVEPPGEELVK